jgi:hypothetical protein
VVRYVGRGPLEWDGADVIEVLKSLTAGASESNAPE